MVKVDQLMASLAIFGERVLEAYHKDVHEALEAEVAADHLDVAVESSILNLYHVVIVLGVFGLTFSLAIFVVLRG